MTVHSLVTTLSALNMFNMAQVYIAIAGFVVGLPACLILNQKLLANEADVRPFKWGYYIVVSTLVSSVGNLMVLLRSHTYAGDFAKLEVIYYLMLIVLCGWALMRDRRGFLAMTICTLSPFIWLANGLYLKHRWKELAPRSVSLT